jgi:hypothetical protein
MSRDARQPDAVAVYAPEIRTWVVSPNDTNGGEGVRCGQHFLIDPSVPVECDLGRGHLGPHKRDPEPKDGVVAKAVPQDQCGDLMDAQRASTKPLLQLRKAP